MSGNDPKQAFPNGLKRDSDPLIPNQSVAGLTVQFTPSRISKLQLGLWLALAKQRSMVFLSSLTLTARGREGAREVPQVPNH